MNVYWAARRLDSLYWAAGNHHFILILLDKGESLNNFFPIGVPGEEYQIVTLAAFGINGYLELRPNAPADIQPIANQLKFILQPRYRIFFDAHEIKPPCGSARQFVYKIEALTLRFHINSKKLKPVYTKADVNCSSFVNTVFKLAGVSRSARIAAGEFRGIDWGEEDLLDERLFR